MPLEDKIEAVKKVGAALDKPQGIPEQDLERLPANKEHFQSLLDATQISQQRSLSGVEDTEKLASSPLQPLSAEERATAQKSGSGTDKESQHKKRDAIDEIDTQVDETKKSPSSLMNEVGKLSVQVSKAAQLTPTAIKEQAQSLIAQIDTVKTQLSQAQGEIKPSYQTLLTNRLTHINDNLKIALSKAGVEYTPPPVESASSAGTLNPIERFLGYLTSSQYQIRHMEQTVDHLVDKPITPSVMLALQIKMGYIQQQIELFTSLLNKALESTKTIMNVQV